MKFGDFLNIEKNNLIQINNTASYIIAGVRNYGKGILNKRNVKGSELTMKKYQLIKENQLMWCKVDTKNGAFGITKKEHVGSLASTNMCLANIEVKKVLPDFLQLLFTLDWFYNWITEKSTGTTNRQYLTPPQILDLVEIPNFTISEQREFIRKYDAFTNGGLDEELKFQQTHLQQLRQAILQEAVQGKLTKQNKDDEPADKLLQRIKAEKQKLIAAGKLKKEKELPPINEDEIPFDLPKGWVWCRLGEILNEFLGGYAFKSTDLKKEGVNQVLRLGNVKNDKVLFGANPVFVNEVISKNAISNELYKGDILITMTGTRLKRDYCYTVLLNENDFFERKLFLNQRVGCLRFNKQLDLEFINLALKADNILDFIFNGETGTANQGNIGVVNIKSTPFPLPPLSEQHRIVAKVQQLLQMINQLEQQVAHSQTQAQQLLQAVLKEAFSLPSEASAKEGGKGKVYEQNEVITMAAEE